jgi:predicted exporter
MEMTMPRTEKQEARAAANQQRSLEAFLAAKAEFDALVAELQQASADHFGADPETVVWEHAAMLQDWNRRLRDIADAYHRRGEYAV